MQKRAIHRGKSDRKAAILPMVAVMLPVMIILSSFVVNVAYMELTRTELRIATDAASRAAGHTLVFTGSQSQARTAATEAGKRNQVTGKELLFASSDIEFGIATRSSVANRYAFTLGGLNPNAVRVTGQRTEASGSGSVGMVIPTFGAIDKFEPIQNAISSQVELDVVLVLDRSGSMAYGDTEDAAARASLGLGPVIAPPGWWFCDEAPSDSRWRDLVPAVNVLLSVLDGSPQKEFMSLVTYNSSATIDVDLTGDYTLISAGMDVYTQSLCAGATNIRSGIEEGINSLANPSFSRPWAAKVIIVLTDGKHNVGSGPEGAAQDAFDQGITVYTVTFSADADQYRMQQVAKKGGGKHFHAADKQALKQAFSNIAASLPTLLVQ